MLRLTLCILVSFFTLYSSTFLVPGYELESTPHLILGSFLIGFLNFILSPLLIALKLRINVFSLGMFTFIINFLVLNISTGLIDDFSLTSWTAALWSATILAFFQPILDRNDPDRRKLIT